MRKDREIFLDEEVLRIQNEVRRYKDEQGIYDGNVDDKMQWGDSSRADTDNVSDKSRGNILQNSPADIERQ